jgi:hypothetical protein
VSATSTDLPASTVPAARTGRRRLAPLAALLAAQLAAGVAVGLIWLWWAPSAVSYLLSDGSGGSLVIPDESEAQVAGDGRFVALTMLAGVLFGLLAWTVRRLRGPLVIAVLGVGSLLGSTLAMATGRWLSGGTASPAVNTAFHPKLTLHASSALWLQALAAVLVYTALVGLSGDPSLGATVGGRRDGRQPAEPAEPSLADQGRPDQGPPGPQR